MPRLVRPTNFDSGRSRPLRGAWGQSPLPPIPRDDWPPRDHNMRAVDILEPAPEDGYVYGRRNGEWVRVVPLEGATMTGPLMLHDDPTLPLQAATKRYVDNLWLRINGGRI